MVAAFVDCGRHISAISCSPQSNVDDTQQWWMPKLDNGRKIAIIAIRFVMKNLNGVAPQWWKKSENTFTHFNRLHKCDGQSDGHRTMAQAALLHSTEQQKFHTIFDQYLALYGKRYKTKPSVLEWPLEATLVTYLLTYCSNFVCAAGVWSVSNSQGQGYIQELISRLNSRSSWRVIC